MDVKISYRTFAQLSEKGLNGLKDPCDQLVISESKRCALQANPYLSDQNETAQIVGVVDGNVAGGEYVFPIKVRAGDSEYQAIAGSTLSVAEAYRKSGLGLDLPEYRLQAASQKVAIGAGLSQMALPVHEFNDYSIFYLQRRVMLLKSRSVVEMKLPKVLRPFIRLTIDSLLTLWRSILKFFIHVKLLGLEIKEVTFDDVEDLDAIESIIASDSHQFSEVHDSNWFRWHLNYSFVEKGKTSLMMVSDKGKPVAFYMTKTRFHEQASHRGFKNVWLGSVEEWGTIASFQTRLKWILLNAVLSMREMDAVEICTDDVSFQRFFVHCGMVHVGEGNFVIKISPDSPMAVHKGWQDQAQWRLRPASGDNGLS